MPRDSRQPFDVREIIARLVDGGATPDGHPYLVLEHVDGRATVGRPHIADALVAHPLVELLERRPRHVPRRAQGPVGVVGHELRRSEHRHQPVALELVGVVPEDYREEFQRRLAALRDAAPTVGFKDMRKVIEQELGVSLFHRHARGLILTEQGDLVIKLLASRGMFSVED